MTAPASGSLRRSLGTSDATVVGLGAMLGAGVFVAVAPAARAAGSWLLLGLAAAALVAYCNATSSARLAARHPRAGGTYVYAGERLGPFWGHLAGWSFVVGKTASCAAMALTIGSYVSPDHARPVAAVAAAGATALALAGVQRTTAVTRVVVVLVLLVLAAVVVAAFAGAPGVERIGGAGVHADAHGVLQAAGLLFFAFAGYARIATLGEEVREPAVTIPRAVRTALGITLVTYACVAVAALAAAGPSALAASPAPLRTAVRAVGAGWLEPAVRGGAVIAAFGALLALLLGVSRTTLAMARDRHLPRLLAAVDEARSVPRHAEVAVGCAVIVLVLFVDLRSAIGFSSFGVLLYYALANASAARLGSGRTGGWVPVVGLAGCLTLAANLPLTSVVTGAGVAIAGSAAYLVTRR
ncbi:APC family permease [Jatrophihabitans fulvus]